MDAVFISQLARQLGCRPRDISDAFYDRVLDESVCPIVAGRRIIPLSYVPTIEALLRQRGRLQSQEAAR